jgi:iron complex outermembrane receptor protein
MFIYFELGKCKLKFTLFSALFLLDLRKNTLSGKSLPLREYLFLESHTHWNKTKSSDVSGNYLIKKLHAGNIKVFVSYVGFQSDTLVNLDGDQVLNFALKQNTDQLQEVVIRQKSQYAEQIDFGTKD